MDVSRQEYEEFKREVRMALNKGDEQFAKIVECQTETCEKLDVVIKNTNPIVQLIQDAEATGRMADRVQNVTKQLFWWGTILVGILAWVEVIKLALKNMYDKMP
jgi:hypothetical protein